MVARTISHAQITVSTASIGITFPSATLTWNRIRLSISDGGNIRTRADGTAPTSSVGVLARRGIDIIPDITDPIEWNNWRAIRDGSLDATVEVEFLLD